MVAKLLGYQGIAVVIEELLKIVKSLVSSFSFDVCYNHWKVLLQKTLLILNLEKMTLDFLFVAHNILQSCMLSMLGLAACRAEWDPRVNVMGLVN